MIRHIQVLANRFDVFFKVLISNEKVDTEFVIDHVKRSIVKPPLTIGAAFPNLPTQVSLGATWGDFNGDGFLDLYVGGYEVWPDKEFPDVVFLNEGGKRFVQHWKQQTILRASGITAADYDRDGDLDIYVSNYRLQPNSLLQNDGHAKFSNVANKLAVDGDGALGAWGHTIGSAWADFDNDGAVDLVAGGRLMRNTKLASEANHWLKVNLNPGPDSNAFGIGTEVRIQLGNETLLRQVEGGTGQGNQNDLGLHFGLGQYADDVKIQVRWADGKTTVCESGADQIVTVTRLQ